MCSGMTEFVCCQTHSHIYNIFTTCIYIVTWNGKYFQRIYIYFCMCVCIRAHYCIKHPSHARIIIDRMTLIKQTQRTHTHTHRRYKTMCFLLQFMRVCVSQNERMRKFIYFPDMKNWCIKCTSVNNHLTPYLPPPPPPPLNTQRQ